MKFRLTIKDPDVLQDALDEATKKWAESIPGLDKDERETVANVRRERVSELCRRWFENGEYFTIEVDTDEKTAAVIEVGK